MILFFQLSSHLLCGINTITVSSYSVFATKQLLLLGLDAVGHLTFRKLLPDTVSCLL